MELDSVTPSKPKGRAREAVIVFAATIVVAVVVIASVQTYTAGSDKKPFPISSGDWIEYRMNGTISNESGGGEFIYYFTERVDRAPYYIATIVPRAPMDQVEPFYFKPMIESQTFPYDDKNLYVIGDLLAFSMSNYDGANATGLTEGWFGTFVNYEDLSGPNTIVSYTNGESAHYIKSNEQVTLEQWVANDTGLPIKLRYADGNGTDITLTISYTNIHWINDLPR